VNYRYIFFHEDDTESFLNELKKRVQLRPKFKKFRYTEIFAEGDEVTAGKYENVVFLLIEDGNRFEVLEEYLDVVEVEIVKSDERFKEFKYGRYRIENDEKTVLELETGFDERLFLDLIPAIQILVLKVRILLNQCNLQAETMSKEESRIIKEVSHLSHLANKSRDVFELEKILSEVSSLHVSFFSKFSKFKDVNEEIFSSIVKLESVSREIGGWYEEDIQEFKDYHQSLIYFESKFEQTLNGVRDLFSLISLQLDTMRNRENIDLQKRTSSLQAAAAIIEFVAVFYYTLRIWEHFLPIENIPRWLTFFLLTCFTTGVVVYTELLAKLLRFKRLGKPFILATIAIILILLLMITLPIIPVIF
jgi:hypothetical protein